MAIMGLLLFAGFICWALFRPSQPRRKRRRPMPDEDVWLTLSEL
jgi:hypothetical protein